MDLMGFNGDLMVISWGKMGFEASNPI